MSVLQKRKTLLKKHFSPNTFQLNHQKPNTMKKLFVLFTLSVLIFQATAQKRSQKISFQEARKKKLISFTGLVNSIGDKRRLKLAMKNNSKDTIQIELECGRIFHCEDPQYQPFVVIRSKDIVLAPLETKDTYVNAVCGNSGAAHTPDGYKDFKETEMGSAELVGALQDAEKNHLDSHGSIQTLVWIFTNNHPIAALGRKGDSEAPTELMAIASKYKGEPVPVYHVTYQEVESGSQLTFSGKPERITSEVSIVTNEKSDIRIVIKDKSGEVIKYVQHIQNQQPGSLTLPLDISLSGLQRGEYALVVETNQGEIVNQQKITI